MRLVGCELRRVSLPLTSPFESSRGVEHCRDALLLRLEAVGAGGEQVEGWGECVAMPVPGYSPEYVDGAAEVTRRFLLPLLGGGGAGGPALGTGETRVPWAYPGFPSTPVAGKVGSGVAADVARLLAPVKGHMMAKAAVEMAVLDAELRLAGRSLASYLGAVRTEVPAGVSVGVMWSLPALMDAVEAYVAEGYVRVKLKVGPGWDVVPVRAVRERWPDLLLQVDANGAYSLEDAGLLRELDAFGLVLIEQPLDEQDLSGHAELARMLSTPICLDESITSARAAVGAISAGACSVVNLKAGRVGGYLEAVRVHDVCFAAGVGLWCGGMLETGLGRAANVALAALPGFTLPGDLSASGRYFERDIVAPFVLEDGCLAVPTGPGLGLDVLAEVLAEVTTSTEWVPLAGHVGTGERFR